MEYFIFESKLDDFLISEYGSKEAAKKYDIFMQTAMNEHMRAFCLSFVNDTHNMQLKQKALKECDEYMRRYTRELRK